MHAPNSVVSNLKIKITSFMAATPSLSASSRASSTIIFLLRLLCGGVASELLPSGYMDEAVRHPSGYMDGALLPQIDSRVVHCVLV